MDMIKIGQFLSELRHEQNLTQEQLGEEIGVSNKTISRWETGTYLPPVEMLQILSKKYNVSINEILSGERLNNDNYKEKAEENIKTVLNKSAFTIRDKEKYFNKKWLKEHTFEIILEIAVLLAICIVGVIYYKPLSVLSSIICILWSNATYNRKRAYIEKHIYGEIAENK